MILCACSVIPSLLSIFFFFSTKGFACGLFSALLNGYFFVVLCVLFLTFKDEWEEADTNTYTHEWQTHESYFEKCPKQKKKKIVEEKFRRWAMKTRKR